MVVVGCTVPNCEFKTADVSEALAIALLSNHGITHNVPSLAQATSPSGPKLDRPKVDVGLTVEEWNVFVRRWDVFRTGSGITDASAPSQLFQCAGPELGDRLLKANPHVASAPLKDLLSAMRAMAVIPVATCVLRTELLQLRQERDESFRAFTAKVRGKAETCSYNAKCECGKDIDYTDHIVRDVLLNGIYDPDIRREVLGTTDILQKPVNDVVALVETKEMARNALPSSALSAMSSFKRLVRDPKPNTVDTPTQAERAREATCPDCKGTFKVFTEGTRGWNTKPHQVCISCFRDRRRKKRQPKGENSAMETQQISQLSSIETQARPQKKGRRRPPRRRPSTTNSVSHRASTTPLTHHIFSKGEWRRAQLKQHPRVPVTIMVDNASAPGKVNNAPEACQKTTITAIADTGAQSDLWSLDEYLAAGFPRDKLRPVFLNLSAANRSPIKIEGAFFATLSTTSSNGKETSCRSMVYVSSCVKSMYLSYDSLLNLSLLPNNFPSSDNDSTWEGNPLNTTSHVPLETPSVSYVRSLGDGCSTQTSPRDAPCPCPQRTAPPPRPTALPFSCTPENNSKMKAWLLQRYSSSTFNTCPHRALPCMDGPPVEIHIDESATPKACHTPANIPLHWQQKVHDDLIRDEALGVIEKVPYGEPVTWCHRMVVTRKHDGSPRRTVDLSPLNKYCKRETFASESPFQLARRIPKNTWKTVTDAWNGYHSVPLRVSDRHLTTFITPFGRWRYTRAPQGFLSSGDGYNRRFDAVLSDFERKERCVDDTIHYDTDLEAHWWRTIHLLTRVGQSGIVLNPDKFQFAEQSVDFAGFRVSDTTIEPLPKYLDAIRNFPRPESTTDIRSWFGLVNQVTNYAQLRDMMAPFKPFLSPRCKFTWSPELEAAFLQSKEAIVEAIHNGVEIFDMKRRTRLRPDWSRRGIGYFLLQKHCSCPLGTPDCCNDGWRITLAGSRFLSPAEQRYAAIEGEALAVAWGLEQTRYFTQGCDNLVVATDHKPLVKIFGDRTLDEITNSRLFRLKQRTLPWRFDITHLPGNSNQAADATSRHPASTPTTDSDKVKNLNEHDHLESALMASIQSDAQDLSPITWTLLQQETAADPSMSSLLTMIEKNSDTASLSTKHLGSMALIRDSVYSYDGVLLHNDRVIIPLALRPRLLNQLHAAHQGASTMEKRARAIAYWPGMSQDIQDTRDRCSACNRNAPSQAATPPLPSSPPSTPFEAVFADFFDQGGHHYLVVGDRLSGWVEVFGTTSGSDQGGSAGLVRHLRALFATFGVPEELSSDGGPEFTATHTEQFLRLWGVRHRVSSVAFPQSNGRAEVAVKAAKRLLMCNTSPTGSLNQDRFLRAMLQLRNTPDSDCDLSPAQIIFGRPLRDSFTFVNKLEKYSNPYIRPLWRDAWAAKEQALRTRLTRTTESLMAHSRPLRPLKIGERVFVQNQTGPHPTKWDRSGKVIEHLGHDQYQVKVDGSGRLTLRNRRFLRAYTPVTPSISQIPTAAAPPSHRHNHRQTDVTDPPAINTPNRTPTTESQPSISLDNPSPPADYNIETQSEPQVPPPQDSPRPHRARKPPKRYEPESGTWVEA